MMQLFNRFPVFRQYDEMDCGPSCLRIICKYFGRKLPLHFLRNLCQTNRLGSSLLIIKEAAEKIGFTANGISIGFDDLKDEQFIPCIIHWNQNHFVVVYKISKNHVWVSDPAQGRICYSKKDFLKNWAPDGKKGVAMILQPTEEFFNNPMPDEKKANAFAGIMPYLNQYQRPFFFLLLFLVLASIIQVIPPYLTQQVVDNGIKNKNLGFVYLLLLAQLGVFVGSIITDVTRNFIILRLSNSLNIKMISAFLKKLMQLPLGFFDNKMTGDTLQRIADHQRLQIFFTTGAFSILFSLLTLLVFSLVLLIYNQLIFLIFLAGSIFYFLWFWYFMKKRAVLDYKRFSQLAENQEKNIELIHGMQEVKLHNAENKKRTSWEILQQKLFAINLKGLTLQQIQVEGAAFINELKNILITFIAAKLVINDSISIGVMMGVAYITGQLNSPVSQLLEQLQSYQDAKLSAERITEIHQRPGEEAMNEKDTVPVPAEGDIVFNDVSFKYIDSKSIPPVLEHLNFSIPRNKVTAVVGASGSGKTTMMKLLLKFYSPGEGNISVGNIPLTRIEHTNWRNFCGAVLQEGYIFSDTILGNIVLADEQPEIERLQQAVDIANIGDFIKELPMGFETKIGQNGMSISTGQKQRILIARAVYKNPSFILFDEATSALDAKNEREIVHKLEHFFTNRTVLIIAHRLSTVKNADQIIVLDKGHIIEQGTHPQLVKQNGVYFNLIKDQLELGS